jgi:hypothetical protein
MHFSTFFTACIASASQVLAQPVISTTKPVASPTINNACALVSSSSAAQAKATKIPQVDGQLAFDCLNSVSLHKTEALALIDAILPYIEWQTGMSRFDLRYYLYTNL